MDFNGNPSINNVNELNSSKEIVHFIYLDLDSQVIPVFNFRSEDTEPGVDLVRGLGEFEQLRFDGREDLHHDGIAGRRSSIVFCDFFD